MPDDSVIAAFGEYDYNRLLSMNPGDIKKLTAVHDNYEKLVRWLNTLIEAKVIFMMDKESGVAWEASGVIGYEGSKLLLFHER
jgi:hypothetical protein